MYVWIGRKPSSILEYFGGGWWGGHSKLNRWIRKKRQTGARYDKQRTHACYVSWNYMEANENNESLNPPLYMNSSSPISTNSDVCFRAITYAGIIYSWIGLSITTPIVTVLSPLTPFIVWLLLPWIDRSGSSRHDRCIIDLRFVLIIDKCIEIIRHYLEGDAVNASQLYNFQGVRLEGYHITYSA